MAQTITATEQSATLTNGSASKQSKDKYSVRAPTTLGKFVSDKTSSKSSDTGDFGFGPWKINDVLIPPSAGLGMIKKYYQRRTLYQYAALFAFGLWGFRNLENPAARAASLGLLFPGAGLTAVGTIGSAIAFLLTLVLFPISFFIWFAMGGLFFPLLMYFGPAGLAAVLAKDSLVEQTGVVWAVLTVSFLSWCMYNASSINAAGYTKQQERNKYLVEAVKEQQANAVQAAAAGSRELDLGTLRFVQHMLERGLSKEYEMHDVIDQFQTGAVRYQLYGVVDALSLYQCHYAPGFHGYLSKACRNAIEKSLTKRIMSYWKWESIFGKFTLSDWDPIKKDNIMVTGYLGVALGLYESSSGDRRYHEPGALDFVIADGKHYKTNYQGIADALNENMTGNPYCLYPCEPNWTYSLCNLTGMGSLIVSDRLLGRNHSEKLRHRFEQSIEEEFSETEGRILTIRSEFTGLTWPGLCGTLTDCINAMLMTAYLPHIAHRTWAMIRKEFVSYDNNGKLQLLGLKGADLMDPGNYKGGQGAIRAFLAASAAEFGDEQIKRQALEQLDNEYFPVEATPSGSRFNKGLSATSQVIALMARMIQHRDLANATIHGPPQEALSGPLLENAPFPEVLVAKAYSVDGAQLDLVLYPGKEDSVFDLGFERLVPGAKYNLSNGKSLVADGEGKGQVSVPLKGRTQIIITPAA